MKFDSKEIGDLISKIPFVSKLYEIRAEELSLKGRIQIKYAELPNGLDFDFTIFQSYPLKIQDSESIKFNSKALVSYNHVMAWGDICIHTSHNPKLEEKLLIDFNSLKNWIDKYYLGAESDLNYEHIAVNAVDIGEKYYSYFFTECNEEFAPGEYGTVEISKLKDGKYKGKTMTNRIVQSFISVGGKKLCKWSSFYSSLKITNEGIFFFLSNPPAKYGRIPFEMWQDFDSMFSDDFLNFLSAYQKEQSSQRGRITPLFLGYRISEIEIHWQVVLIEIGKFPIIGIPEKILGRKTGKWLTGLNSDSISWAFSRNSSYNYFFGRGTLCKDLIEKKILIVGVGAVGSNVAKTLVRGGCKNLTIIDYDMKEAENVCRSEYAFANGISGKVEELYTILTEISPFVELDILDKDFFEYFVKFFHTNKSARTDIIEKINDFDLIFDCSTDNDLMYILDNLKLKIDIINISITNHAKEMVCAFYPNIYRFVNNQFGNVLKNDLDDVYNPTGCWNPTFKASYNDISALLQFAIKHINRIIDQKSAKNNFIVKEIDECLKIVKF